MVRAVLHGAGIGVLADWLVQREVREVDSGVDDSTEIERVTQP